MPGPARPKNLKKKSLQHEAGSKKHFRRSSGKKRLDEEALGTTKSPVGGNSMRKESRIIL